MITITRQAGANAVLNGLFLDSTPSHADRDRHVPQAGHDDAGELDRHLRRAGLRHRLPARPASPPTPPSPPAGQSTYTWTTTSTDPRALQVPGSSNRVAAVWYSATSFTVDVNLTDGQTHDLELYFLDWDNKGRGEQVQISDAGDGHGAEHRDDLVVPVGVYLDWTVAGNVLITITREAGANAVLNGLFLDSTPRRRPPRPPVPQAGHDDAGDLDRHLRQPGLRHRLAALPSLPSYATVTPAGQSTYTWTTTTTDPRALQVPGVVQPHRRRLVLRHQLHRRRQPGRRPGARPGAVLPRLGQAGPERAGADQRRGDRRRAGHPDDLVVPVGDLPGLDGQRQRGDHDHQGGRGECRAQRPVPRPDATPTPTPPPRSSSRTRRRRGPGSGPTAPGLRRHRQRPSSLPTYATVTPAGQSTYTWATSTTDPRALQVAGGASRIAAAWYSATSFTVDVNLTDGQTHDLELYFLDWDKQGRSEQVQISNATTGAVLDTQTVSSFQSGVYLDYAVSGNVVITITKEAGTNAVLSGLFLDGTSGDAVKAGALTTGAASSGVHAIEAASIVETTFSPRESKAGPQVSRGSGGGWAMNPAAGPVNAAIGALTDDDDDATAPTAGLSIHDLALEQFSGHGGRRLLMSHHGHDRVAVANVQQVE